MLLFGMTAAVGESGKGVSDETLLKQVGTGDREAFRQLYQNTDRTVYSFILSIVKNPSDAEEILQETYLKVWTSASGYVGQGKPLAWIFTIARNLCYMRFRDRKHEVDVGLDDLNQTEMGELCRQIENVADRMALMAALEILKEDERQIVILHASAGMKHREIAASLQMPLATVLSKYRRAMKKLEEYLGRE